MFSWHRLWAQNGTQGGYSSGSEVKWKRVVRLEMGTSRGSLKVQGRKSFQVKRMIESIACSGKWAKTEGVPLHLMSE